MPGSVDRYALRCFELSFSGAGRAERSDERACGRDLLDTIVASVRDPQVFFFVDRNTLRFFELEVAGAFGAVFRDEFTGWRDLLDTVAFGVGKPNIAFAVDRNARRFAGWQSADPVASPRADVAACVLSTRVSRPW